MAYLTWAGFHAQSSTSAAASTSGQLADHSAAIHSYWISIAANLAITLYCWWGVRIFDGNLAQLTGGRWTSLRSVGIDLAITIPFCLVWLGTANAVAWLLLLLGPTQAKSTSGLLPQSTSEIILWILVSVVAGFCEEIQSRGYLQQQLHAFTGSLTAAVLLQAAIFGLIHSYQGWRNVIVIAVLGLLYGALAAWRRNLRANMLSHAALDVWAGWLGRLVWR